MTIVLNLVSAISTILTAYFAAYGLRHDYRDGNGKLTKAGQIALRGSLASAVLSLLSLALTVAQAHRERLDALRQLREQARQHTGTLLRLERIITNTERLSRPIGGATFSIRFLIPGDEPNLAKIRNTIRRELPGWMRTMAAGRSVFARAFNIFPDSSRRDVEKIVVNDRAQIDASGLSFKMTHAMILAIPGQDIKDAAVNAKNSPAQFEAVSKDVADERLVYYPREDIFGYELIYKPEINVASPRFSSMLDLLSAQMGISVLLSENVRRWTFRGYRVFNDAGYSVSADAKTLTIAGDTWPRMTYVARFNSRPDSKVPPALEFR